MQEAAKELILTFENIYQQDSYKSYHIHDLTDFKSEGVDDEMDDIKEDILTNIKDYLHIETVKCKFTYKDKESLLEGIFPLAYTIENVNVVFHDHYTYDSYKNDDSLYIDMYEHHCSQMENKYDELYFDIGEEQMDVLEKTLHEETQEFVGNTRNYITNESTCFISNYYYSVNVVITLTTSRF